MRTTTISKTKSGHEVRQQNCFNEYVKADNKEYLGYEYTILDCRVIYIYEDTHLVRSAELTTPKYTFDSWAKYYIHELINKANKQLTNN
jgi:hypothetical protein